MDEVFIPDTDYPMVMTTGRQLEHWHTGSMTRRASVLDAVEPEANASLHPKTLRKLGVEPGEMIIVEDLFMFFNLFCLSK